MKRIYIVSCEKIGMFNTFKNMGGVMKHLKRVSEQKFDSQYFSIYGSNIDGGPYLCDSCLFSRERGMKAEYFEFIIRCIDENGQLLEIENN